MDVNTLLGKARKAGVPLDPYLIWATATGFRYYATSGKARDVGVIVKCKESIKKFVMQLHSSGLDQKVHVPEFYGDIVDADVARFCTAQLGHDLIEDILPFAERIELGTAIISS